MLAQMTLKQFIKLNADIHGVFGLMLFIPLAVIALILLLKGTKYNNWLDIDGIVTRIDEEVVPGMAKDKPRLHVHYEYFDHGRRYSGSQKFSTLFSRPQFPLEGDPIPIKRHPDDPTQSIIQPKSIAPWALLLVASLIMIAVFIFGLIERSRIPEEFLKS